MLRRMLISFLLVFAGCSGDSGPVGTTAPSSTTTTGPATETTTTTRPDAVSSDTSVVQPPEQTLAQEVDELIDVTERVRGLEFLHSPDVAIQPIDEFREQLDAKVVEDLDMELIAAEEKLLETIGVLDPAQDLEMILRDLLAQQVLGYYEPETKQLFVRDAGVGLSGTDKLTIVHELVHALTDQYYAWGEDFLALVDSESGDELRALQTIIEGDATFHQSVYMATGMLPSEFGDVLADAAEQQEASRGVPPILLESLAFPYTTGALYMQSLSSADIEQVYVDPPVSTEQILTRSTEAPIEVAVPGIELGGYSVVDEFTVGQGDLEILITSVLDAGTAAAVADGWGGDRVQWLWDGNDIVEVTRYIGDTPADAAEYAEALSRWFASLGSEASGSGSWQIWRSEIGFYAYREDGPTLDIMIASDATAGEAALAQLGA
ncbi:MAG: hypothetical protein KJN81_02115 [Acidimicrobiia bacterium]|nr:hypothetical protein [Acidimicrobiia bacterium]NNL27202.1 hypothetical protein [Acidimicrobiia bacterium]